MAEAEDVAIAPEDHDLVTGGVAIADQSQHNRNEDDTENSDSNENGFDTEAEIPIQGEPFDENCLLEAADLLVSYLGKNDFVVSDVLKGKFVQVVFLISRTVVAPAIKEHSKILKKKYLNVQELRLLDSKNFLNSCRSTLNFIEGCAGQNLQLILTPKNYFVTP